VNTIWAYLGYRWMVHIGMEGPRVQVAGTRDGRTHLEGWMVPGMNAPREHLDGTRDGRTYYRVETIQVLQMDVPRVQVAGIRDAIMAGVGSPILFLFSNNCAGATESPPAASADKNRDELEALPLPANVEILQNRSF
jgi:hypothetical protein